MRKWTTRIAVVAAAVLGVAPRLFAQGCAMCYADAAAQGPRARHSLDFAILTLLVPSVLLFAGVIFAAFRRRERDVEAAQPQAQEVTPREMAVSEPCTRLTPDASASSL